jgi:magnesium-transporting ATPase (P-type)
VPHKCLAFCAFILNRSIFQVDNSSLTGETEPLRRVPEQTNDSPFETKNLAFYGTFFTEGSGKVVVYATGDRTFLGTIATSTMNTETRQSTLNIEIHYFIKIMSVIAIALGVTFFIIAVAVVKYPILEVRRLHPLSDSPFLAQLSSHSLRRLFLPLASSLQMYQRGCYPRSAHFYSSVLSTVSMMQPP